MGYFPVYIPQSASFCWISAQTAAESRLPVFAPSVCRCQQPLNNRWDPHPLGLSLCAFNRLPGHLAYLLLCLRWAGELVFNTVTLHADLFVSTTGPWSIQQKKREIVISQGWRPVTGNWTSEMLAPSSSFWLCEILAAVDLHCHVKDERSCLPWVKYCLLQFLCSLCPAGLATGCLPVWLEDQLLFLWSHFF